MTRKKSPPSEIILETMKLNNTFVYWEDLERSTFIFVNNFIWLYFVEKLKVGQNIEKISLIYQ